eukprot:g2460.t1
MTDLASCVLGLAKLSSEHGSHPDHFLPDLNSKAKGRNNRRRRAKGVSASSGKTTDELSNLLRSQLKSCFDIGSMEAISNLPKSFASKFLLSQLFVDGMSREQIWEEVEMHNEPMIDFLRKKVDIMRKHEKPSDDTYSDPEHDNTNTKEQRRSSSSDDDSEESEDSEEDLEEDSEQESDADGEPFLPARKFKGALKGYVFKKDSLGIGYYLDTKGNDNRKKGKKQSKQKKSEKKQSKGKKTGSPHDEESEFTSRFTSQLEEDHQLNDDMLLDDIEHFSSLMEQESALPLKKRSSNSDNLSQNGDDEEDSDLSEDEDKGSGPGFEDENLRNKLFGSSSMNTLLFENEDAASMQSRGGSLRKKNRKKASQDNEDSSLPVSFEEFFGYPSKRERRLKKDKRRRERQIEREKSLPMEAQEGEGEEEEEEEEEEHYEGYDDAQKGNTKSNSTAAKLESSRLAAAMLSGNNSGSMDVLDQLNQLEQEALAPKAWHLMGEATGKARPKDSLLDIDLEAPQTSSTKVDAEQLTTAEATVSLEEMIKERIANEVWDDPIRRTEAEMLQNQRKTKGDDVENDGDDGKLGEKSSIGLGDVYANEYAEKVLGYSQQSEKFAMIEKQVKGIWEGLSQRLDALANFHYTPLPHALQIAVE